MEFLPKTVEFVFPELEGKHEKVLEKGDFYISNRFQNKMKNFVPYRARMFAFRKKFLHKNAIGKTSGAVMRVFILSDTTVAIKTI